MSKRPPEIDALYAYKPLSETYIRKLSRRQRLNIWWRYIGAPQAYGLALLSIYLTVIGLFILIVTTVIR